MGYSSTALRVSDDVHNYLLDDDIRCVVADAAASGEMLRLSPHARRLKQTYPGSDYSERRIVDELIIAASAAKVAVEIARAD